MTDYLDPSPSIRRRQSDDPYAERDPGVASGEVQSPDDDRDSEREPANLIPSRLRTAIEARRSSWRPVDSLAMAIIGVQLFVLFIETVGGSLYLDDLRAQAYALNQPFWSFIMGSNGTHFAPLPRVLDWVQSRAFPLEHGPAVVVTLIVRLALTVMFWRLLRRIFGARPATLVPLVLLVITPALLPATLWYRQSITIVACTAIMLWALDAHLRWLLRSNRLALIEVPLATAAGLGFYEKAAVIPAILIGLTVALFARRDARPPGAPDVLRPTVVSVLLSSVVIGGFLIIYRSGPYDQGSAGGLPSVFDVVHLTWDTTTRDIIPLLLGGPYRWTYSTPYAGTAHLSTAAVVIVLVITGIGLLLAGLRRPSPLVRSLFFLASWTVPSVAVVAAGRFETLQLVLADATRLWVDLVPAFILAAALAVLPWEIGVHRSNRDANGTIRHPDLEAAAASLMAAMSATTRSSGAPAPATRRALRDQDAAIRARPAPVAFPAPVRGLGLGEPTVPILATAVTFALILLGSGISTIGYVSKWWDNPTGTWLKNMRASVSSAEPYARVLATPLPESIMPRWVSTQLPTNAPLLLLVRKDLRFHDGDGAARALNASGTLSPFLMGPIAQSARAKLCAVVIPPGSTQWTGLQLTSTASYVAGAQIEVGVLLSDVSRVRVQVQTLDKNLGRKRLAPQALSSQALSGGAHVLHYPVPLNQYVTGVFVQTDGVRTGCIASARVWAPLMAGS